MANFYTCMWRWTCKLLSQFLMCSARKGLNSHYGLSLQKEAEWRISVTKKRLIHVHCSMPDTAYKYQTESMIDVLMPDDDSSLEVRVHHPPRLMYNSLARHLSSSPQSLQRSQYLVTGHLGPDCGTRWIKQTFKPVKRKEHFQAA